MIDVNSHPGCPIFQLGYTRTKYDKITYSTVKMCLCTNFSIVFRLDWVSCSHSSTTLKKNDKPTVNQHIESLTTHSLPEQISI